MSFMGGFYFEAAYTIRCAACDVVVTQKEVSYLRNHMLGGPWLPDDWFVCKGLPYCPRHDVRIDTREPS
jgi:hypothetical protein